MRRVPQEAMARQELLDLLDRAVSFRFQPDLAPYVDTANTGVSLEEISSRYVLHVAMGPDGRWGILRGEGPYWWDSGKGDWMVGFRSLGSRDRTLYLMEAVLEHYRREVCEIALTEVNRERERRHALIRGREGEDG